MWWIFLDYAYIDESTRVVGELWMPNITSKFLPVRLDTQRGVIFNPEHTGYYIVNYDTYNWNLIANTLKINPMTVKLRTREQITHDIYWLYKKDKIHEAIMIKVYSYLSQEPEYLPWIMPSQLFQNLYFFKPESKSWIESLIKPQLSALGMEPRMTDTPMQVRLRKELLSLSSAIKNMDTISYSRQKFSKWKRASNRNLNTIPVEYQVPIFTSALQNPRDIAEEGENIQFAKNVLKQYKPKGSQFSQSYNNLRKSLIVAGKSNLLPAMPTR